MKKDNDQATSIVGDFYNKIILLQAQIFKLEEMLYENHALDKEQLDKLMPSQLKNNIPDFGDF